MRAIDIETLRGLIVIDVAISYIYSVTWTHVRDPYSYINKFTVLEKIIIIDLRHFSKHSHAFPFLRACCIPARIL